MPAPPYCGSSLDQSTCQLAPGGGANAAGRADLHTLVATGHVVLGGLMPSRPGATADAGEAHADRFTWDVRTQKGLLEATPFVRITQGPSVIVAPLVRLESPKLIVLKGPKQVSLIQERDEPHTSPLWLAPEECELARDVPGLGNSALIFLNSTGAHGASVPDDAPSDFLRYVYQARFSPDAATKKRLLELLTTEEGARRDRWVVTR